jgi:hypothetical protein
MSHVRFLANQSDPCSGPDASRAVRETAAFTRDALMTLLRDLSDKPDIDGELEMQQHQELDKLRAIIDILCTLKDNKGWPFAHVFPASCFLDFFLLP